MAKIRNWQPLNAIQRRHIPQCPTCNNADRLLMGRDRTAHPIVKCLRCVSTWHLGLKKTVLDRDGWHCQKCLGLQALTIHHVVPVEAGGKNVPANCATLCLGCHKLWHKHERERIARWQKVVRLPSTEASLRVNRWRRIASEIVFRRWLA